MVDYIEEKLEAALGHFRKDFMSGSFHPGVYGPQFGVYGSFLPVERRHKPMHNDDRQISETSPLASSLLEEAYRLRRSARRLEDRHHHELDNIIDIRFESALKSLSAAFLLERCCRSRGRLSMPEDKVRHIAVYVKTAELFGRCARAYERCKKDGVAAVSHKCEEAALWRAVECARRVPWCSESVIAEAKHVDAAILASHRARRALNAAASRRKARELAPVKAVLAFSSDDMEDLVKMVRQSLKQIAS